MMSVKWDPIYSVHIRVIDEQHQRFVQILSQLDDAIRAGNVQIELEGIFEELAAYTKVHFSTEEMYFDKFGYEGTLEHKASHAACIVALDGYRERAKTDPTTISSELIEFLHDWLADHLVHMDKGYVKCFHEHGLT